LPQKALAGGAQDRRRDWKGVSQFIRSQYG
jgi:hypothetical protein